MEHGVFSRETGWKMLKKWGIDDGLMMVFDEKKCCKFRFASV